MEPPRPRILCTEDDIDTREMINIILANEGFEVTCAESPHEAIERAKTQTFDLVLVDNWMPVFLERNSLKRSESLMQRPRSFSIRVQHTKKTKKPPAWPGRRDTWLSLRPMMI